MDRCDSPLKSLCRTQFPPPNRCDHWGPELDEKVYRFLDESHGRVWWRSQGRWGFRILGWLWGEWDIVRFPSQTLGTRWVDISGPTELDAYGVLPRTGPQSYIPELRSHLYYCRICKAPSQGSWDSICKPHGLIHGRSWITDSCYYGNYLSALWGSTAEPCVRQNCKAGVIIPGQRASGGLRPHSWNYGLHPGCTEPHPNYQRRCCGTSSSQRKVWKGGWSLVCTSLKVFHGLKSS